MKSIIKDLRLSYHETPAQHFERLYGISLSKIESAIFNVLYTLTSFGAWTLVIELIR